ncbi:MAG: hypothetical protein ACI33N_03850 [Desulfovibrionaceae bacterium]
MTSWLADWSSEVERESVIPEEPERLAEQPAADTGTGSPAGCADALHGTQAGTDTSMPEKADTGHDGKLLPQIAKLGQENGFFLAPMRGWGLMLWANDRMAAEAARDIAPWVLDHHAEILAELEVGSPMVRDWTVPRVVFVGLGPEGKILESHN